MAVQSVLWSSSLTTLTKNLVQRPRPYVYNASYDTPTKLQKDARRSFPSGHTSAAAALSFYTARVMTQLHPNMRGKGLLWATAAVLPATTGYLRYKAGKHFPSDVLVGYALGALIGYWVPSLHLTAH